jgi:serine/threonine-protein kinase
MNIRQNKLPIAALERIDELCQEFEKKWQSNQRPDIESVLEGEFETLERDALLAELIALDIDYRRRCGETPTEKDYLDRFPNNAESIDFALVEDSKPTGSFELPNIDQLSQLFPALQFIELIGAGGMGAVYKARQQGLDRIVAIKILPEEFGHDIKFALRFTREARTLAKLNHPNIVGLYEFGKVEDTYYFLMEYVEGSSLREVVKTRELTPQHALAIVPHLCDALQYAHDKGVIHRDIKPDNILMSVDGSVKIADFGLSRILGSETQHTLTGTHQVMGTPRYMAPEQLEGTHNVDHRADIYSLGVVIYEMLTGELPIGRFAAPSQKVEIDVRLDEVVLRTLEKEPQRRYQRASQIKSDVQSITSNSGPNFSPTLVHESASFKTDRQSGTASLEQQELAGRLLLTRRQLMGRVKNSLQPLFNGQMIQVVFGIVFIIFGALCWAKNTDVLHRVICGVILHVYGVITIAQAANVATRIKRIDFSEPVDAIRNKLDHVRSGHLRAAFAWWLMWIPVSVALGFDEVATYPQSLYVGLAVGVVGFVVSVWLYTRAIRFGGDSAELRRSHLSGRSIKAAHLALDEIEKANID